MMAKKRVPFITGLLFTGCLLLLYKLLPPTTHDGTSLPSQTHDDGTSHSDCGAIHVAMVSEGFTSNQNLVVLLKSILFNTRSPLHLHIITQSSAPSIDILLQTWALPGLSWRLYNLTQFQHRVHWIPNSHYSGIFGLSKLLLPEMIARDRVIVLDTDIVLDSDIQLLWSQFQYMSPRAAIGLVENMSGWYSIGGGGHWPAVNQSGFNTGVMLVRLDRLRAVSWPAVWTHVTRTQLVTHLSTQLADQDIVNAVLVQYPSMLHPLPCQFNCQYSDHRDWTRCPPCAQHPLLVHWNLPSKNAYLSVKTAGPHRTEEAGWAREMQQLYSNMDGYMLRHRKSPCFPPPSHGDTVARDGFQCWEESQFAHRVHTFFMPHVASSRANVSLVTHLTLDRVERLEAAAARWPGPISASLYLQEGHVARFVQFWAASPVLKANTNIALHLVLEPAGGSAAYPINLMRNVALDQSGGADYVILLDGDFVPSADLPQRAAHLVQSRLSSHSRVAVVIPAFEMSSAGGPVARTKEELLAQWRNGSAAPYRGRSWPAGHAPTNFTRWRDASAPYPVRYRTDFEPYILTAAADVPRFNEQFQGYGWNKVVHTYHLSLLNYTFLVDHQSFLVHVNHPPSPDLRRFRSSGRYRACVAAAKERAMRHLRCQLAAPAPAGC